MEISATTPSVTTPAASATETKDTISSDFETFLKMLTVQMQNQDPLNPVKSEDFAVQLATFSGVEQQVKTNDLLEALSAQMGVTSMGQIAGWVGMEARGAIPAMFDGAAIDVMPPANVTAESATLIVRDANGIQVDRRPIATDGSPVSWDGQLEGGSTLPHGAYTFRVAFTSNGVVGDARPAEVYSRIVEARSEHGSQILITEGGHRTDASAVTGLREPSAA